MPVTPETQPSYAGGSSGFLTNELRETIEAGGMTASLEKLLSSGRKDIARSGRTAREGIREAGASSGFSGTGANLFSDVFESEAVQGEKLLGNIGQQAEANRFRALGELGTQSRFEGTQRLAGDQFRESKRQFGLNFEENKRQFGLKYALEQERLAFEKEQAEGDGWFADLVGGVFGTGVGLFTGGLGSGLASSITRSIFGDSSSAGRGR
jgi:hypothetical protein